MTVGTLVNHWAHGRGIVIGVDVLRGTTGKTVRPIVKVHWEQPVEWDGVASGNVMWTDPEELDTISEAK